MEDLRGWQPDPSGRHEERLFSQGEPTALARDGGQESQDAAGVCHGWPAVRA